MKKKTLLWEGLGFSRPLQDQGQLSSPLILGQSSESEASFAASIGSY